MLDLVKIIQPDHLYTAVSVSGTLTPLFYYTYVLIKVKRNEGNYERETLNATLILAELPLGMVTGVSK